MTVRTACLAAAFTLLPFPSPASAQSIAGRVLDENGGSPVDAVLVELLRPDSTRVRATLSANGGRYSLRLDGSGPWLVRLDRLGYRATIAGPFTVSGDTAIDLRVAPEPVGIAPIEATGEGRCEVRPDEGMATARLWEQIRKVLAVTDVVSTEGLLEFELLRFVRDLNPERTAQRRETLEVWTGSDPFLGYPGEILAEQGFIQPASSRDIYWFMPDADVILSDAFLDTHCFSVVERFEQGRRLLGLSFEPIDDDRDDPDREIRNPDFEELVRNDPADVSGVLWVDGTTGALETLEYGYTGIRDDDIARNAGGYARFEQLADGKWVVRQWWIRMPRFVGRAAGIRRVRGLTLTGVRETGGEIVRAWTADGSSATRRAGQRVTGRVMPGDLNVPIDSSTFVRFSGTAWITNVSPEGAFAFGDITPGRYLAMVHHPRLDTLGIALPVHDFTVGRQPVDLTLDLPSRAEAIRSICPRRDSDSDRGIIVVYLENSDRHPVAGERVRLRSARRERTLQEVVTGEDGIARFCDAPPSEALEIVLRNHDERASVSVDPGEFARRDLVVGRR